MPPQGPCLYSSILKDGMHWCVEMLGARYTASVTCLLGCVHNSWEGSGGLSNEGVRECERECSEQFMTIKQVDEGWIGNDVTIFSH